MSSTVKDVAKLAGVSATTVSLVMNGKSGISQETRTRVMQAAKTLNYTQRVVHSVKGDALGTLRFLKIAMHGHTVNRDHNTFISDYIDGMSREASASGYKLEIVSFEGEPIEAPSPGFVHGASAPVLVAALQLGRLRQRINL